jgi:hypothetical protein
MFRFFLVSVTVICATVSLAGTGLSDYFPRSGETPGWNSVDTLMEYAGDDLFQMIDGGAEIYREYGFVRAGMQEFVDKSGHSVTIELYEMKDPGAAYGMFSFKARGEGRETSMGNGGRQTDYYLNFWKGRYLATLTGLDTSSVTRTALNAFGSAVEKKITETEQALSLPGKIGVVIDSRKPTVTYIRGPIALSNFYRFGASDVFGCKDGYVVDYADFETFAFGYDTEITCLTHFAAALTVIGNDSTYTIDTKWTGTSADQFMMADRRGRRLLFIRSGSYIVVAIGRSDTEVAKAADEILKPLR